MIATNFFYTIAMKCVILTKNAKKKLFADSRLVKTWTVKSAYKELIEIMKISSL